MQHHYPKCNFFWVIDVINLLCMWSCCVVCLKGYHIHIRSISHNQNMAEAKKKKALAKKQNTVPNTSSLSQSRAVPASATANRGGGEAVKPSLSTPARTYSAGSSNSSVSADPGLKSIKSILKSAQNQSSAGMGSTAEKPAKGPNYCDVCCF